MSGVEAAVIAVSVAAAAAQAYSIYQTGQSQAAAARYNRQVAQNQATLARQQAALEEETTREKQRRFMAAQRAAFGAAGVTEEGSPLLVMADTARQAERDLQLIRYGGEVSAAGFEAQAGLQRFYARQAERTGAIGAGVSLLGNVANIASQSYYWRRRTTIPTEQLYGP